MMKRILLSGVLLLGITSFAVAQSTKAGKDFLNDEICDRLCAAAQDKSKDLGIDISFAIVDRYGLPRVYRRYGDALVLSITLVPGKAYTSAVTQCRTKESSIVNSI